jgi:hypothetical protein
MELATCEIEVTVVLLRTEEGVANSTARGRGSCDSVRWPWHSNNVVHKFVVGKETLEIVCDRSGLSILMQESRC